MVNDDCEIAPDRANVLVATLEAKDTGAAVMTSSITKKFIIFRCILFGALSCFIIFWEDKFGSP